MAPLFRSALIVATLAAVPLTALQQDAAIFRSSSDLVVLHVNVFNGKSDAVPSLRFLERLHTPNEFLIASHHPLRETIMVQTGSNEAERREFLNAFHTKTLAVMLHQWEPKETAEALF